MSEVLKIGQLVDGRYRVEAPLGQGGMGMTYAAVDEQDGGRSVAIKVLSMQSLDDWKVLELFEREAKVLEQLSHPNIPRFIAHSESQPESDQERPFFYLVQELVEGQSVAQRVADGWHPDEAAIKRIATDVLQTLIYLHGLQPPIIHRDIKPQNIIMRPDGRIALVDFGAVKDSLRSEHSFASTVVGTYGYMAPEQFRGHAVPSSDLYALGATLVNLVTHKTPSELPQKRLMLEFRPYCTLSEPLASWLDMLLEPAHEDRIESAAEALERLEDLENLVRRRSAPVGMPDDDGPPLALPPPPLPAGSRIEVKEDAGRAEITLPAAGIRGLNFGNAFSLVFALFWLSFVAVWTTLALAAGPFALFSLPFWFVGIFMMWNAIKGLAGSETLVLTPDRLEINYKVFGVTHKSMAGPLSNLYKVSRALPKSFNRRRGQTFNRASLLTQLDMGVKTYQLGGHLTDVENEWLTGYINAHTSQQTHSGFTLPSTQEEREAQARARQQVGIGS